MSLEKEDAKQLYQKLFTWSRMSCLLVEASITTPSMVFIPVCTEACNKYNIQYRLDVLVHLS